MACLRINPPSLSQFLLRFRLTTRDTFSSPRRNNEDQGLFDTCSNARLVHCSSRTIDFLHKWRRDSVGAVPQGNCGFCRRLAVSECYPTFITCAESRMGHTVIRVQSFSEARRRELDAKLDSALHAEHQHRF